MCAATDLDPELLPVPERARDEERSDPKKEAAERSLRSTLSDLAAGLARVYAERSRDERTGRLHRV